MPYEPALLLGIFGLALLIAFSVTALGVLVATAVKQAQTFNLVAQVLVFPTIFLSGAMYPVADLPTWLAVLNRLNPLAYAVDAMRRLVFDHLDVSEAARDRLAPGVTWWGRPVATFLEAAIVLALGSAVLTLAITHFSRTDQLPSGRPPSTSHRFRPPTQTRRVGRPLVGSTTLRTPRSVRVVSTPASP